MNTILAWRGRLVGFESTPKLYLLCLLFKKKETKERKRKIKIKKEEKTKIGKDKTKPKYVNVEVGNSFLSWWRILERS